MSPTKNQIELAPKLGRPTKCRNGKARVTLSVRVDHAARQILEAAVARNPDTSMGEFIDRAIFRWTELRSHTRP